MEGEESVTEGSFEGVGEVRFMAMESCKGFFEANKVCFGGGMGLGEFCDIED